ncbi:MAG: dihydrofolate reductase [Polyangiaceae bacterium]
MTAELHVVAAVSRDLCIGKDGALPWRLPEDLRHFRALTRGHVVIMGRATFVSIGRPLPERRNIVVSRTLDSAPDGTELARSLEHALELARATDPAPRVIGGEQLYREALAFATHLHITHVDVTVDGCTARFPAIDPARFVAAERRAGETPGLEFVEYRAR